MVETHKRKRKNTAVTKITLTICNAEHIKQTLSTNKPYRHQQHLPKITKKFLLLNSQHLKTGSDVADLMSWGRLLRLKTVTTGSLISRILAVCGRLYCRRHK